MAKPPSSQQQSKITPALIETGERLRRSGNGEDQDGELADSVLVMRVGSTWLGVSTDYVKLLAPPEAPLPIPRAPAYIQGLIMMGGRALPVIDMATFLDLATLPGEKAEQDVDLERVVVVASGELEAGLRCDRVFSILNVTRTRWKDPHVLNKGRLGAFLLAETETSYGLMGIIDVVGLLDAARIRETNT